MLWTAQTGVKAAGSKEQAVLANFCHEHAWCQKSALDKKTNCLTNKLENTGLTSLNQVYFKVYFDMRRYVLEA